MLARPASRRLGRPHPGRLHAARSAGRGRHPGDPRQRRHVRHRLVPGRGQDRSGQPPGAPTSRRPPWPTTPRAAAPTPTRCNCWSCATPPPAPRRCSKAARARSSTPGGSRSSSRSSWTSAGAERFVVYTTSPEGQRIQLPQTVTRPPARGAEPSAMTARPPPTRLHADGAARRHRHPDRARAASSCRRSAASAATPRSRPGPTPSAPAWPRPGPRPSRRAGPTAFAVSQDGTRLRVAPDELEFAGFEPLDAEGDRPGDRRGRAARRRSPPSPSSTRARRRWSMRPGGFGW